MDGIETQAWVEPFSSRELDILRLISDGRSNQDISRSLHLSLETVKWYNKRIFLKLGVSSRIQAANKAAEMGLFNAGVPVETEREAAPRTNLPAQITSFIGREKEISEIHDLLQSSRLVVLTGPGGTGKTRLAIQVAGMRAASYRDGVWLVELASVQEQQQVPNQIVQALRLRENTDALLVEVLKRFLRRKHLLLLMDNFEHLPEATPLVGELLAAAPQLSVLATSRERLHVYGEQEYPVLPLRLPDLQNKETPEHLLSVESIRLFLQRAKAVQPGFTVREDQLASIAQICIRLDGLPLAIELAASQVKLYPPSQLMQRLERGLSALGSGPRDVPLRHRTLQAAIQWSENLLPAQEKTLFARMAVFSGGGRLEAIEQICCKGLSGPLIDRLMLLVEKNLVLPREDPDGELRFTMLETIHEYAEERLAAGGEEESLRRRHAEYYTRLAESAAKETRGVRQPAWFARLRAELDNLRSVLAWSLDGNDPTVGMRTAAALQDFWNYNGLMAEGTRWLDRALSLPPDVPPDLYAGSLRAAGFVAYGLGDFRKGKQRLAEAVDLYTRLGDERNAAWSMAFLSMLYTENPGEYAEGLVLGKRALSILRKIEDKPGIAQALNILGETARLQSDYEAAQLYYEESLEVVRETGERLREAMLLCNLGFIAYRHGRYSLAMQYIQSSLAITLEVKNDYGLATMLGALAGPTAALGDPVRGAHILGFACGMLDAMGYGNQPSDVPEIELYEAAIRQQLGEEAFQTAWQEGQAMSYEDVISLILAGQNSP